MKVGVALPHYDFSFSDHRPVDIDSVIELAHRVEHLGYDSAWVSDHFFLDLSRYGGGDRRYGSLEAMTILSALARETERLRLGTMVLCEAFRPPTLLARMAATLDLVSDGRLELGLGAGWYEAEYEAAGIPFPPAGERIERLDEALRIIGGMLEQPSFSFEGRFYRTHAAPNNPQPMQRPRPPLWIGSKGGPKLLRVIAERADGWNLSWRVAPGPYRELLGRLAEACARAERDPTTVRLSVGQLVLVGTDDADLRGRVERMLAWAPAGPHPDEYATDALVGTPERCAERIMELEALGVELVILSFANLPFALHDEDQLDLFATEVLPQVR